VLGALGIFAGARCAAMRGIGARLSAAVGGLLAVFGLAWFVIAFVGGVLILLALVLVPIAGVAAGFALSNLDVTRRADEARQRLRAQGLDAGL
jgi:fatty acid desaturase